MRIATTVIEQQMRTNNDDTRNNQNEILIDTVEVGPGVSQMSANWNLTIDN